LLLRTLAEGVLRTDKSSRNLFGENNPEKGRKNTNSSGVRQEPAIIRKPVFPYNIERVSSNYLAVAMMIGKILSLSFTFLSVLASAQSQLNHQLDSLFNAPSDAPFNGVVLITKNGKQQYLQTLGFRDSSHTQKLNSDNKFVIGSVSKQFTAVLILQQSDRGLLKLNDPITKYLNNLPKDWDTITIDQLLSHTHGIVRLDKPLAFKPGTRFMYSQHGYELLAQIIEKVTGSSFADQSKILFEKCGMKNTCHPSFLKNGALVPCFTRQPNGSIVSETKSLQNFPAAGGFVSTAGDLAIWNQCLFGGKLLSDSILKLMVSAKKNAVRDHPIFGMTRYGYGITIDTTMRALQYGQTGFADGFASMNFYFPNAKTSVVALENIVYAPDDLRQTFYFHAQLIKLVKEDASRSPIKK
jgi:D-alanyl-D-alanine carboxypeptidase